MQYRMYLLEQFFYNDVAEQFSANPQIELTSKQLCHKCEQ